MLGTQMPLYPPCIKLTILIFEKLSKVYTGHTQQLKSMAHTKLQTAFSRRRQLCAKSRGPINARQLNPHQKNY